MTDPVDHSAISRDYFPNLLLICGSGRDTGKTLLVCNIIEHWKIKANILAVKISMHAHEHKEPMELIIHGEGYTIWKETQISEKDSGRFLNAGAQTVFYIETSDRYVLDAFRSVMMLIKDQTLVICESGGLAKYVKPALILYVQGQDAAAHDHKDLLLDLADKVILSESPEIRKPETFLTVENYSWKLI